MSFVLEVKIRIKPEQVENFMAKLAENAKAARTEPGCKTFDVSVDPNDRTSVMLYEVYADEKAFEAHQATPHFKKYLAEAIPLLASRERRFWKRV
jgi:(4S)-4-hydroxy-5-phosphonooxypentane-2,3-dione isomerase